VNEVDASKIRYGLFVFSVVASKVVVKMSK
jgi:hypothetical protein